jgi:hypothetical protein
MQSADKAAGYALEIDLVLNAVDRDPVSFLLCARHDRFSVLRRLKTVRRPTPRRLNPIMHRFGCRVDDGRINFPPKIAAALLTHGTGLGRWAEPAS